MQRGATIAGAALAGGLAVAAKVGFGELAEGQKVAAQTSAVLESTGAVANVTARQVDNLSTSLSKMTGVDDEAIAAGENLLLTFTNIRNQAGKNNDVFNQTTRAALDMSVAMGTDMKTSALQLGKALNDPEKGMTRLQRSGVQFTDAQKELVKQLVATGDTLGAQKVILGEVNREFGGSAKAYGETMPGQLAKAKNAFAELAAGLVVVLLPALLALGGAFSKVAGYLTEHETTAKALGATLVAVAGTLLAVGAATKLYAAGQAIIAGVTAAWTAAQWLLNAALTANPIGIVVVALAALVAGLVLAYKNSETFRNIVQGAFKAVQAAADAVLNFFRNNWKTIAVLISGPFAPIVLLATDAFGIRSKLIAAGTAVLDFFRGAWATVTNLIVAPIRAAVTVLTGLVGAFSNAAQALGTAIKNGVVAGIGAVATWLGAKLSQITGAVTAAAETARTAALQVGQAIIGGVLDGLAGLWNAVKNKVENTVRAVLGSLNPFSPVEHGGDMYIGAPIVEGAAQAIVRDGPKILQALYPTLKALEKMLPLFQARGQEIGAALATGLLDMRGQVEDAANQLAAAVAKAMSVSYDIGRAASGNAEARRDQIVGRIPGLAEGGIVNRPTLALIGEAGPEAVVPLRGAEMVGATYINLSFPNYVGARDDLIREVRSGLAEVARDNPNIFAGKA